MPALPGAASSSSTLGSRRNVRRIACSRAPEPITRMRTSGRVAVEAGLHRRGASRRSCEAVDVPTSLEVERLISVVATESALLAEEFQKVQPQDSVPSCPDWTAADLLGHIGGVQRWAAAMVAGARTANVPDAEQERLFRTPAEGADPDPTVARALLTWFEEGTSDLVGALSAAPSDLRAMHFLKDAPAPRHFWARREAHEVTIHRVDMLAARLGRLPATGEAAIDHDVAVDGIDELVCGFLPRRSSRLRTDEPFRVAIRATDAADHPGWTVAVSADPPVTTLGAAGDADAELRGTAAALYLGLWNRGDDVAESGAVDALGQWRELVRVGWS